MVVRQNVKKSGRRTFLSSFRSIPTLDGDGLRGTDLEGKNDPRWSFPHNDKTPLKEFEWIVREDPFIMSWHRHQCWSFDYRGKVKGFW